MLFAELAMGLAVDTGTTARRATSVSGAVARRFEGSIPGNGGERWRR